MTMEGLGIIKKGKDKRYTKQLAVPANMKYKECKTIISLRQYN